MILDLKNIYKDYQQDKLVVPVLKDVSLQVEEGEYVAVMGPSGSGKTTLMNMLSGIYYPDAGKIYVNGEAVSIRSPEDAFVCGIGMIHQHFKLVDVFTATI